MAHKTTYSAARANLAALCDKVTFDHEVVVITRRNSEDVALVSAKELTALLETAHLLHSPKNARRLLTALKRAQRNKGKVQSPGKLRRELGLEQTAR